MRKLASLLLLLLSLPACSVGEGEGEVKSERLYVETCWEGPFDLRPNFFGANPFRETMNIRLQRGQQGEEVSDGVLVLISDASQIRDDLLGQRIPLGLSASVTPPGHPVVLQEPPLVTLSMYLHQTCHRQNATLYSVGGWIRFTSLFSGNVNENDADRRYTEAEFEAVMANPRDGEIVRDANGDLTVEYPGEVQSVLTGNFQFFFHRGSPAQAFP